MASIIPHRVLSDLVTIAQSNASVFDRHARIVRRIDQFRAAIARSRHQTVAINAIIRKLELGLEAAAGSRALGAEQRSALILALQILRSDQGCLAAEESPARGKVDADLVKVR